jgi:hypothetical protein
MVNVAVCCADEGLVTIDFMTAYSVSQNQTQNGRRQPGDGIKRPSAHIPMRYLFRFSVVLSRSNR